MSTSYAPYDGQDADPYASADPYAAADAYAPAEPHQAPAAVMPYAPPVATPYAANPYAATAAQQNSTNSLAIVAMILSLLGMGLIGAILGHVALGQISGTADKSGRTMALVAIWVGWISVALGAIAIILSLVMPMFFLAMFGIAASSY